MGLLEICCEEQPSDRFEIVTFASLASQGDARELLSFATIVILKKGIEMSFEPFAKMGFRR
jgi:hypothetical protein